MWLLSQVTLRELQLQTKQKKEKDEETLIINCLIFRIVYVHVFVGKKLDVLCDEAGTLADNLGKLQRRWKPKRPFY